MIKAAFYAYGARARMFRAKLYGYHYWGTIPLDVYMLTQTLVIGGAAWKD